MKFACITMIAISSLGSAASAFGLSESQHGTSIQRAIIEPAMVHQAIDLEKKSLPKKMKRRLRVSRRWSFSRARIKPISSSPHLTSPSLSVRVRIVSLTVRVLLPLQ
ncbi:hypothetical protein ACIQUF_07180 [Pseudomonas sp. NPDC090233]|uniref:hypothetical protein n=1 Tax=Pseudomonas sp. NPDC090233 TaxID=3364479 RepID=UPI00383BB3B8